MTNVYGTALSPNDLSEEDVKLLPGGWTTSDLDLSPWVKTIFWEVALRARRPLSTTPPGNVNGRRPCGVKTTLTPGQGRVLCFETSIILMYPPSANGVMISNIWPFPIRNAPKELVERTAAQLEKVLRDADLLVTDAG